MNSALVLALALAFPPPIIFQQVPTSPRQPATAPARQEGASETVAADGGWDVPEGKEITLEELVKAPGEHLGLRTIQGLDIIGLEPVPGKRYSRLTVIEPLTGACAGSTPESAVSLIVAEEWVAQQIRENAARWKRVALTVDVRHSPTSAIGPYVGHVEWTSLAGR